MNEENVVGSSGHVWDYALGKSFQIIYNWIYPAHIVGSFDEVLVVEFGDGGFVSDGGAYFLDDGIVQHGGWLAVLGKDA